VIVGGCAFKLERPTRGEGVGGWESHEFRILVFIQLYLGPALDECLMRELHIDFFLFTLQSKMRIWTLMAARGGCGLGGLVNEAWWVWQGQLSRPAVHI